MDETATGTPFPSAFGKSVDEWSMRIFDLLASWPAAQNGKWTRWEPGYLVLEISQDGGVAIDPIVLDTDDEELTVTFGHWETHLPGDCDADVVQAVDEAKALIGQWLSGDIRTAVFTDAHGKWCGSRLIEGDDLLPQLDPEWIRNFNPTKVEVRAPTIAHWRQFAIKGDDLVELTSR